MATITMHLHAMVVRLSFGVLLCPGSDMNARRIENAISLMTTAKLLWFDESEFAAVIGALVYNETQCDFLRRSTFDPIGTRLTLADLISAPSELRNLRAYQLIRQWPVKQPPPMDYHGQRRCPRLHTFKFWILCDLVVSVEFVKTLTFFESLSDNDKLLLSRNAAVANCSLMQSYYSYKSKSNKVMFPDGIFPILFTK
uniref:NR LBD domain-containing protein n=1 Tax=Parascaris univalens TaxID=6257 RepID=A0A915ABJ1_PARUN